MRLKECEGPNNRNLATSSAQSSWEEDKWMQNFQVDVYWENRTAQRWEGV